MRPESFKNDDSLPKFAAFCALAVVLITGYFTWGLIPSVIEADTDKSFLNFLICIFLFAVAPILSGIGTVFAIGFTSNTIEHFWFKKARRMNSIESFIKEVRK